jgi:hypothetical protein
VNLQRITRIHVLVAGVAAAVAVALVFVFVFVMRSKKETARIESHIADSQPKIAKVPEFERALEAAIEQEKEITVEYDDILDTRMPDIDLWEPIGSRIRMMYFSDEEYTLMSKWFRSSGAEVSGFSYPTFGWGRTDPKLLTLPPLRWTLSVSVDGGMPELFDWLKKLPEAPRFMQLESVTIHGPRQPGQPLTATVPVIMWLWTGLEPGPAPTATASASAATGTGGGGMRGGMRGGMGGGMGGGMRGGRGGGMRGGRGGGMRGGG